MNNCKFKKIIIVTIASFVILCIIIFLTKVNGGYIFDFGTLLFINLLFPSILFIFALLLGVDIGKRIIPLIMIGINLFLMGIIWWPIFLKLLTEWSNFYINRVALIIILFPSPIYTIVVFLIFWSSPRTEKIKIKKIFKTNNRYEIGTIIVTFSLILFFISLIFMIIYWQPEINKLPIFFLMLSFPILILSQIIYLIEKISKKKNTQQSETESSKEEKDKKI